MHVHVIVGSRVIDNGIWTYRVERVKNFRWHHSEAPVLVAQRLESVVDRDAIISTLLSILYVHTSNFCSFRLNVELHFLHRIQAKLTIKNEEYRRFAYQRRMILCRYRLSLIPCDFSIINANTKLFNTNASYTSCKSVVGVLTGPRVGSWVTLQFLYSHTIEMKLHTGAVTSLLQNGTGPWSCNGRRQCIMGDLWEA